MALDNAVASDQTDLPPWRDGVFDDARARPVPQLPQRSQLIFQIRPCHIWADRNSDTGTHPHVSWEKCTMAPGPITYLYGRSRFSPLLRKAPRRHSHAGHRDRIRDLDLTFVRCATACSANRERSFRNSSMARQLKKWHSPCPLTSTKLASTQLHISTRLQAALENAARGASTWVSSNSSRCVCGMNGLSSGVVEAAQHVLEARLDPQWIERTLQPWQVRESISSPRMRKSPPCSALTDIIPPFPDARDTTLGRDVALKTLSDV
jgi:hypothetical protein